ncbi:hypothetical protein [Arthrobacter sp. N1]|uniref:hypothetical protein n=1 Tax=Arthrobacter sp. N1 TaxID=619291 RepID=UPI003BB13670
MGNVKGHSAPPQSEEYVPAIERAFVRCPSLSGLRLLSAEARLGFATVRFEGPVDDFRGPYGAMVRLPKEQHDDLWNRYVDDRHATIDDWAHAGIAMRAVRAHTLSQDQDRGYTLDGVWWIINDCLDIQ